MLYSGDIIEVEGFRFRVELPDDNDGEAPWDRSDGHGPVSDWTRRDKRPGERVLMSDHGSHRFYDFAEAMKLAKRDGWGRADGRREGETIGAYRARAVESDFDFLRRWCAELWSYVGVVVTLLDDEGEALDGISDSLWGIESDSGDYLAETARELASGLLDEARTRQSAILEGAAL